MKKVLGGSPIFSRSVIFDFDLLDVIVHVVEIGEPEFQGLVISSSGITATITGR